LINYLDGLKEHTALYDSARTDNFFLAASSVLQPGKQTVPTTNASSAQGALDPHLL
jgi:hypothetical protein